MKKWSFLVAALLMMSATVTTTSCIDNDEPEGITVLRGAKAELLKAKAALELAKVKTEEQTANLVAAQAAVKQAIAKEHEAQAKINEAIAEKEKAQAAYTNAQTEIEKAKAEKELARLDLLLEEQTVLLETLKAQQEAELIKAKQDAAEAQATLDNTLAEIEAAKAVLTKGQADLLQSMEDIVADKFAAYTKAQTAVLDKMADLFNAEDKKQQDNERFVEELAEAKADAEALKTILEDLNELNNAVEITEWETKLEEVKNAAFEAEVKLTEIAVQEAEIAEANKELHHKIVDELEPAASDSLKAYNKAFGNLSEGNAKYKTSKNEIKVENSKLVKMLGKDKLTIPAGEETYKNITAKNEAGEPTYAPTVAALKNIEDVKKLKVTAEEAASVDCRNEHAETLKTAQEKHTEAVEKWEKMHKQYADNEPAVEVDNTALEAAITAYNDQLKQVAADVKAYNDAYDKAVEDNAAAYLQAAKDAYALKKYKAEAKTQLGSAADAVIDACTTLASVDNVIDIYKTDATANKNVKNACKEASAWDAKPSDEKPIKEKAAELAVNGLLKTDATNKKFQVDGINYDMADDFALKAVVDIDEVNKAAKDIESGDTKKPGSLDILTYVETDAKKAPKAGSYQAVLKAIETYDDGLAALAFKLDEKKGADKNALTGVTGVGEKKFFENNQGKDDEPSLNVKDTDWVLEGKEVKYNEDTEKYETVTGHKLLVRTEINPDAIKAFETVVFDKGLAADAWNKASKDAFGVEGRHTAATSMTKVEKDGVVTYVDQEGNVYAEADYKKADNTLANLAKAQEDVDTDEAILAATEEIATLTTAVEAAKNALDDEIDAAKAVVDEADEAAKAADKAWKDADKEYKDLFKETKAARDEVKCTEYHKGELKNSLEAVISTYYKGLELQNTEGKPFAGTSFADLKKFIQDDIQATEKKIKDAEKKISMFQKDIDQLVAKEDFDAVAHAKIALEAAQSDLETAQSQYEFALAKLNAYVEALGK